MVLSYAWVFWLAGGVLGALGLVVLVRAVWGDRSRGRRRCPKCWYDMAGAPSLVCPECGKDVGNEKRLLKTRRRKRWVAVGMLVLILGAGTASAPRVANRGALGAVPTSVVVVCACVGDTDSARLLVEATARPLAGWQQTMLRKRAAGIVERGVSEGRKPSLMYWDPIGYFSLNMPTADAVSFETIVADRLMVLGLDDEALAAIARVMSAESDAGARQQWLGSAASNRSGVSDAYWASVLIDLLERDSSEWVRSDAAGLLGESKDAAGEAVAALRRALREDVAWPVRQKCVFALGKMGPAAAAAVPDLVAILEQDDEQWAGVLEALSYIRIGAGPVLCEATRDPRVFRRRHAFECLARLGSEAGPCLAHLVDMLEHAPEGELRVWCVTTIASIGPEAAGTEALLARLLKEDPQMDVRFVALSAFGRLGLEPSRVAEHVAVGLQDPERHVRLKACTVLAEMGSWASAARDRIAMLVSDPDAEVAREAARVMKRLDELK